MNDESDFEHLDLPNPEITQTLYLMENNRVLNDDDFIMLVRTCKERYANPPVVCGKQITNTNTNIVTHFLLCSGSQLFDPSSRDVRYRTRNRWKFRRVHKTTYDLYTKFLSTSHRTFLYQAERGI
jgi:hypothetical protein